MLSKRSNGTVWLVLFHFRAREQLPLKVYLMCLCCSVKRFFVEFQTWSLSSRFVVGHRIPSFAAEKQETFRENVPLEQQTTFTNMLLNEFFCACYSYYITELYSLQWIHNNDEVLLLFLLFPTSSRCLKSWLRAASPPGKYDIIVCFLNNLCDH